ncbi:MAG TPA: hypothetical protein PKC43_01995 [Phycisphaerales bacterium]|nr:hypothetical protein [Phycisphaerales bacterium]HMP36197.1 hypothetical protein [Phycisphaerales bacterium]
MTLLRSVLAFVVGVVVAGITIAMVELIGQRVYPPPPDLDWTDLDALRAHIAALPLGALLVVPLAWGIGTLLGGRAANAVARGGGVALPTSVGVVILAAAALTVARIPHPAWLPALGVVAIAAGVVGAIAWSRRAGRVDAPLA